MSIDITTERLISLEEAAKLLPGRDGGTVHYITIGQYCRRGKLGVLLDSVLAGPCRCTSVEAVARFIEGVTAASQAKTDGRRGTKASPPDQARIAGRTKAEAARAARQAIRDLEAEGA